MRFPGRGAPSKRLAAALSVDFMLTRPLWKMTNHKENPMVIRIAAVEASHWHAVFDAAYLRHLIAMPDVELIAIQDSDARVAAKRAAEVGNVPTYTDYRKM